MCDWDEGRYRVCGSLRELLDQRDDNVKQDIWRNLSSSVLLEFGCEEGEVRDDVGERWDTRGAL